MNEKLMMQFHQCMNLMHRQWFAGKRREDFSHRGQGHLLRILMKQDGMTQKEIVEEMDIRPSSASELVTKLEQNELIRKETNEQDKRVTHIFLTDKGREAAQKIAEGRNSGMFDMFSSMTEEEQQQLSLLLDKLITSLKSRDDDREEPFIHGPGPRHHFDMDKHGPEHFHGRHRRPGPPFDEFGGHHH